MGRFDSSTEAALAQIKSGQSDVAPLSLLDVATTIVTMASASNPVGVAVASSRLIASLKRLAAGKDESNLVYFAEALIDDLHRLSGSCDDMRRRIDELADSSGFGEAVENATLYITRTNVKNRLRRLARVIVNGVRDGDLQTENVDDMMRLSVTLSEEDVHVLRIVYEMQTDLLSTESQQRAHRVNQLTRRWQEWWNQHHLEYWGIQGLRFMNSSARLLGEGLVGPLPRSFAGSPTQNDLELSISGMRFYEHLREIATEDQQPQQM
jgi:hypothetical protein